MVMNAPRAKVTPKGRRPLEQISDALEQLFASLRESVRQCPTFGHVSAEERARIEAELFTPKLPDGAE